MRIGKVLIFAFLAWPGWTAPADSYIRQVQRLVKEHRNNLWRLEAPAELTGRALMAGGSLFLTGDEPGWVGEGSYRSGGLGGARPIRSVERARAGDVVWLSYSAETYETELLRAQAFGDKKCVVLAFGPRLASGTPRFRNWIDSLTPLGADRNLVLAGNVLSLWTMTAELASYTSRQGKTPVFLESAGLPGGMDRNNRYQKLMFHDGTPSMKPTPAGMLSSAYLDYMVGVFEGIRHERGKLARVAKEITQRAANGQPAIVMTISHMMPSVISGDERWLRPFSGDPKQLDGILGQNGYLVWFGYYGGISPNVWDAVRRTGAKAAWIAVPKTDERLDFEQYGDVFVDQHWAPGDASIELPGYDIKVLPPSGLAQLFIYELLLHETSARRP